MSSKQPGKQRKAQYNAPIHVKRKRIRARLRTDDPELAGVRTITVRVGDEVEVLRGDFGSPNSAKPDTRGKRLGQARGKAGIRARIVNVNTNSGTVFVDGISITTADGKEEPLPIHASNIVVVSIDDTDPLRISRILEKAAGGKKE